jgi:lipopolysaccharide transport system permease protein
MSSPAESRLESPTLVIEAGRSESHYWRDLWRYRELLGFLAWRDVKVRYKQTALGAIWALVQPIVTTGIFTLIFGKVARLEEQVSVPFALFVLSGVLPWQLAVALVDFAVVLVLYVLMSAWFGIYPNWHWLLLPGMMLLALLVALGAGLWLTALTVKFRDFRYIVPFLLQVGLFLSPIGIRPEFAPNWANLLALNPMTGVIDGFRWCLLPEEVPLDAGRLLISVVMGLGLLVGGLWYFRRTERGFADVI